MTECACGCGHELPPNKGPGRQRKWYSERCRKQALYSRTCVDCGARTACDGSYPERCKRCNGRLIGERNRARAMPQRVMIEAMWADGCTAREIAEAVGWGAKDPNALIVNYRNRGYDLPRRYSPERIAKMVDGSGERMAEARRVDREQKARAGS